MKRAQAADKPAPVPINNNRSPCLIRPSCTAVAKAMGTDAATQFPNSEIIIGIDHRLYKHTTKISKNTQSALAQDFI